jgi:phosphatidylserine decarboxylase
MRLRTENFGEILWLEVGATNVGSITNHLWVGEQFSRGQEKWYFWLGGSAVLVLFQQNKISLTGDITTMSKQWIETEIMTGESIGKSL